MTFILFQNQLFRENLYLQSEVEKLRNALQNSKVDNAELYSKFGELARGWAETVKVLNEIQLRQKKDYENTIGELKKTNELLMQENNEMKKVIEDLKKMKFEFEKQKRTLKLGQIGFRLDTLVSEYVFPGDDRASKRARYGTKLTSLKGKVDNMQDESMKENATKRLAYLDEEMFKDWFLGMVDDMKSSRVATAHPDLGTYEEMQEIINDEYRDDDDMRKDSLVVLERLNKMYKLLNRQFGK